MLKFVFVLLIGMATVAWAQPTDELRACQVQIETLQHRLGLVREVREYYETKLAESRTQLDLARQQLRASADPSRKASPMVPAIPDIEK